jgi:hypothetical protein
MNARVHTSAKLIYSVGTQIVALKPVQGSGGKTVHPAGAVGVIVRAPRDRDALNDLLVRLRKGAAPR